MISVSVKTNRTLWATLCGAYPRIDATYHYVLMGAKSDAYMYFCLSYLCTLISGILVAGSNLREGRGMLQEQELGLCVRFP